MYIIYYDFTRLYHSTMLMLRALKLELYIENTSSYAFYFMTVHL